MVRPLGLPIGSVRAVLLLSLACTAIFKLYRHHEIEPWMIATLLIAGASYFASRAAGPPTRDPKGRGSWWLPSGTIRIIFLALAGYAAWVYFRFHDESPGMFPVAWILVAYLVGLVVGALERRGYSSEEAARAYFEHVLAVVALIAAGSLVYIAADRSVQVADWVQPLLAAVVVHYFATR